MGKCNLNSITAMLLVVLCVIAGTNTVLSEDHIVRRIYKINGSNSLAQRWTYNASGTADTTSMGSQFARNNRNKSRSEDGESTLLASERNLNFLNPKQAVDPDSQIGVNGDKMLLITSHKDVPGPSDVEVKVPSSKTIAQSSKKVGLRNSDTEQCCQNNVGYNKNINPYSTMTTMDLTGKSAFRITSRASQLQPSGQESNTNMLIIMSSDGSQAPKDENYKPENSAGQNQSGNNGYYQQGDNKKYDNRIDFENRQKQASNQQSVGDPIKNNGIPIGYEGGVPKITNNSTANSTIGGSTADRPQSGGGDRQVGDSKGINTSKIITTNSPLMGRGHDIRDPSYWSRTGSSGGGGATESCRSLNERDNLDNPILYVHNVGRCSAGIRTRLKWNPKLASDSRQYSEGVMDFLQSKLGSSATSDSGNNNYSRVMAMLNGKNLHAFIPYTQAQSSNSNEAPDFPPTGQSYILRSGSSSALQLRNTNSANTQRPITVSNFSKYNPVTTLHKRSQEASRQHSLEEITSQLPSNLRLEDFVNNGRIDPSNQLISPEGANPSVRQGVKALAFLRPEYFGGFRDGTEANVTLSSDEIIAADTHLSFYESEKKTATRAFGSDTGLRKSFDNRTMLFNGNTAVGHYYQYLWEDTQSVGCSYTSRLDLLFSACLYYPSGNVAGRSAISSVGTSLNMPMIAGTSSNTFFRNNPEFNTSNLDIRRMVSQFLDEKSRGGITT